MGDADSRMQRLNALRRSKNIQFILDEASKILGNPILAHDMEYKIIAMSANSENDDPIWNEFALGGTVSYERLEFYKNECFFDLAANAKTVTFLFSDKLKYERIFGKLFTKQSIQVGCACMPACYKPFVEEDPELFECVCDILSAVMSNSAHYQNYGQQAMENLLHMLIDDRIEDKLMYTAHVESIYAGLKSNLYVAILDVSRCAPTLGKRNHFLNMCKRAYPEYKYAIYHDYMVALIGTDAQELNIKDNFPNLLKCLTRKNIRVGISSCFENLFELNKYYREALTALQEGVNADKEQYIYLYNNSKK